MVKEIKQTIAVMQPYFIPYTGYFRLLSRADTFVIYDCVQYQRRGWLHRNKLLNHKDKPQWLTLPLEKGPQSILIKDLMLIENSKQEISNRLNQFPLKTVKHALKCEVLERMVPTTLEVVDYICSLLKYFAEYLDISWNVIKSSSLGLPDHLRGADRIIEIVKRLDGTHYLNASGGHNLYNMEHFAENGLTLQFLPEYSGCNISILNRVLNDKREAILCDL